eukprot:Skav232036  [mRNA]  locus=scaffold2323:179025:190510:+ [translate_table: standard]
METPFLNQFSSGKPRGEPINLPARQGAASSFARLFREYAEAQGPACVQVPVSWPHYDPLMDEIYAVPLGERSGTEPLVSPKYVMRAAEILAVDLLDEAFLVPVLKALLPSLSAAYQMGRLEEDEPFDSFCADTAPTSEEVRENVIEKPATDAFRHDAQYMATHISIAPPESKLDLTVRDTRARPMPASLGAVHSALEHPLRSERHGFAPVGHPSDEFYDAAAARAPPQPVPDTTQRLETEFLEMIEASWHTGDAEPELWNQYAKRAEELLITMPLDPWTSEHQFSHRSCHWGNLVFHWLAKAGVRDQTLMSLMGNEALFRLSDDFVLDMYIEVMNAHARLDLRNPRLVAAMLREMAPFFRELSKDELLEGMEGRRVGSMATGCVLKQFRLLEDCLRLDYHPTNLPGQVQVWLQNLKAESEARTVLRAVVRMAT